MDKKGIEYFVISIILILATFAVLGLILYRAGYVAIDLTQKEQCRENILIAAGTKVLGLKTLGDVTKACQTELKFVNEKEKEEVMKIIADELYWCKWQTNVGDPTSESQCLGENRYCVYCSVMEFGEETRKLGSIKVSEFLDYLNENSFEDIGDKKGDLSYYKFLYESQYIGRKNEEEYVGNSEIRLDKPLNIYWLIAKTGIAINKPLFDHVKGEIKQDNSYYNDGLLMSAWNEFVDLHSIDPRKDQDLVRTIFVFQDSKEDLVPGELCNTRLA